MTTEATPSTFTTTRLVRASDGCCHFSNLKRFDLSPAHYRASCERRFEPTRAMRIGTIVHFLVLGQRDGHRIACFEGERRQGKAWDSFVLENDGAELVTKPEWDAAEPIARAVLADPVARTLINGARAEVPLRWDSGGIACATGGVDLIGPDYLADLKTTTCSQPERFGKLAHAMHYHAQMSFYEEGARANGHDTSRGLFLIAVEVEPPYAVTVFRLPEPVLMQGRKSVVKWLERLRVCEDNGTWPAYAQGIVDIELPPWLADELEVADPELLALAEQVA